MTRQPTEHEIKKAILNTKLELYKAETTVNSIKEYLISLERQLQLVNAINNMDL